MARMIRIRGGLEVENGFNLHWISKKCFNLDLKIQKLHELREFQYSKNCKLYRSLTKNRNFLKISYRFKWNIIRIYW